MAAIPRPTFGLARSGTVYPQYDEPDTFAEWEAHVDAGRIGAAANAAAAGAFHFDVASTSSTSTAESVSLDD